ncbi:hypothetical protein [Methylophilus sp. Leaf408]|uniref:hypothetical protein n=1 Tax=Methylophilus sp. Leaf408 TaxID=2876561 RepID=UPI001E2E3140|nr:hypothetical protein [Methylophilus sp. Leaf408]
MDLKKISKLLIFLGIALVAIAFFMDTSVSSRYGRVHNIGLVSQQQNLLILGGIAFLAGIILIATNSKPKFLEHTQANSDQSKIEDSSIPINFRLGEYFNQWLAKRRDNKIGRFLIFLYTLPFAIALGMVFDEENPLTVMPFFVLLLWVLSPHSGKRVILSLLYTHIASAILCIAIITSERGPMLLVCILIVLATINYLITRYLKRKESSEIVSQK